MQGIDDEGGAVRGDADDIAAGPPGGVRHVVGQPGIDVVPLAPQIGFQLDDGRAEHRVDAAPTFRQIHIVIDLGVRGAEP